MAGMVTVRLEDLQRFVERAAWPPALLNTLDADEYRKTIEARLNLDWAIHQARRAALASSNEEV